MRVDAVADVGVSGTDRWVRALHNLYLVVLVCALVATVAVVPAQARWLWAGGAAVAVLVAADLGVRRWSATGPRRAGLIGYFLAAGVVLCLLRTMFPTFTTVAFGVLPLVFVLLPRLAAVAVGVVVTGLPYAVEPFVIPLVYGSPPVVRIELGLVYLLTFGVALPVLTGLFTAAAIQAVRRQRVELGEASRLAGRAEERQRLAHDLHDTLAQGLSGVVMQLEAAEQYLDRGERAGDTARLARLLVRARETARSCLTDTRRVVEALRPESLDGATLADAVANLCRLWTDRTGVPTRPAVCGRARRFHPQVEVAAVRVVQEALANAAKHAGAGEVTITVEYGPGDLRLTVCDDGRGFDPAGVPHPNGHTSGGLGLATMRERVASVGGSLAVTSAPGAGTTVTATLPEDRTPDALGAVG